MLTRHTNLATMRTPSRLELTYLATADALARMVAAGEFPHSWAPRPGCVAAHPGSATGSSASTPTGSSRYASPNAVSAIHRLGHVGDVVGTARWPRSSPTVLRDAAPVDERLALVVTGRAPWRTEVGVARRERVPARHPADRGGSSHRGDPAAARRQRAAPARAELLTKDATIREIHHRVKNNLQTVAALLRLQAAGVPDDEARAALEEAVRRVGTIALVHETLSQGFDETVDFDEIAARGLAAVVEVATRERRCGPSAPGLVRSAAGRGRHRARDDRHRAGAERRRARPRRRRGGTVDASARARSAATSATSC